MTSKELRQKYLDFFTAKGHKKIDPAPIVLNNDPTTLFTSSGMQPLVPYLLGETHPDGNRLVNSQPSFRSGDIEEVGNNRHTTLFEMLGNWSLGDYFKKEEIPWLFEFLTNELNLPLEKLHITCFEGNSSVPKDMETVELWKKLGIKDDRIYFYGDKKNWWSKSSPPDQMPVGEIGGPDTEIFYEFNVEHDPKYGEKCHPNCDCGKFMEICNAVFIEYKKIGDSEFEKLPQKNVDFGGGLERLLAATADNPDIFKQDLHFPIIEKIIELTGKPYPGNEPEMRIIADHLKAATFLILDGVVPSNKLQGYVLRRLLRRSAVKFYELTNDIQSLRKLSSLVGSILNPYDGLHNIKNNDKSTDLICKIINEELDKFGKNIREGMVKIRKIGIDNLTPEFTFDLFQSHGFPPEITFELLNLKGGSLDKDKFIEEFNKYKEEHRKLSRTASSGMFKGGLAGHSEIETKYHTATHLLHQALRDVLGSEVFQKGSNINTERLRFDFSFNRRLTDDEINQVGDLLNRLIKEDLKVDRKFMSVKEAKNLNAIGLFNDKYEETVSVYCIGPNYTLDPNSLDPRIRGGYYSVEFCGGPHVEHTGVIGGIKITKEEAISSGVRRIYAELA